MVSVNRGRSGLSSGVALSVILVGAIAGLHVATARLPVPEDVSETMPAPISDDVSQVVSAVSLAPVSAEPAPTILDAEPEVADDVAAPPSQGIDVALNDPVDIAVALDGPVDVEIAEAQVSDSPFSVDAAPLDAIAPDAVVGDIPSSVASVAVPHASTPSLDPSGPGATVRWTLSGSARAIAANAVEIQGIRVRLDGISAPTVEDVCFSENGAARDCGDWAREALGLLVDGMQLSCDMTLAVRERSGSCSLALSDGSLIDVSEWAIAAGVARVDGEDPFRLADQEIARTAGIGIWSAASLALDAEPAP